VNGPALRVQFEGKLKMRTVSGLLCCLAGIAISGPAAANELFGGVYDHGVDTPFTFSTGERGADVQLGYRFTPPKALSVLGHPAPYVLVSVNTRGNTSFVGAGLSWTIGNGPLFVRPGLGVVVHTGPALRIDRASRMRTDLGSRVLFEPEIALGYRLNQRVAVEASWVHISHAQLFSQQNPGLDMIGLRLSYRM
jgi:hypothetical protein